MLRRHQREFKDLFDQVRAGHREGRTILLWVTPGGGKSAIPVIAASVGIPRIADALCIVTPRASLQAQMEDAFIDSRFRRMVPHDHRVRLSTNQEDPCRGLSGYVTTYQALVADRRGINALEFERKPYILVLDEIHHIEEGNEYHRAVAPLVDRAAAVILMTGTMERSNGRRIAYAPYGATLDGLPKIVTDGGMPVIRYTRQHALAEHAVVLLEFQHLDGDASWIDRDGQMVAPIPISLAGKQTGDAIFAALRTEYAHDLLQRTVSDWRAWKQRRPHSKLLAVAPSIALAKKYLSWLNEMGVVAKIATTEDDTAARKAIDDFRLRDLDALMTVGMAYEGLDCVSITHVACLTHIRSRPWIEQLISRANRFDSTAGRWEEQRGFIYAPDDQDIVQIFEEIRAEQEPFIREIGDSDDTQSDREASDHISIIPLEGRGTRTRAGSLDGETFDYAETAALLDVARELGIEGVVPPSTLFAAYKKIEALRLNGPPAFDEDAPYGIRPSQEEAALRDAIEKHSRGWDSENSQPFGTMNKITFQRFGKSRLDMTSEELRDVWAWLNQEYPRRQRA